MIYLVEIMMEAIILVTRQAKGLKITSLLALFILLFIFVLHTPKAEAAFSQMPQSLAADGKSSTESNTVIHLSTQLSDSSGNGGFVNTVSVKMYHPGPKSTLTNEDKVINLDLIGASGACDVDVTMQYVDSSGNLFPTNPNGNVDYDKTSPSCGMIQYFVRAEAWNEVTPDGGYVTATVKFTLKTPNRVLDINSVRSQGTTRLGFPRGGKVPVDTSSVPGGEYDFTVRFGTPCGSGDASQGWVEWDDDDYGLQPENFGHNLEAKVVNDNTGNRIGTSGPGDFVGKGRGWLVADLKLGYKYSWTFSNVNRGNTINVIYPYDSSQYYLPCNPPSDASCTSISLHDWDHHNPAGGADIDYSTNTLVKVTDSAGNVLVGGGATQTVDGVTYSGYYRINKGDDLTRTFTPLGKDVDVDVVRIYHNTNQAGNPWHFYSDSGSRYEVNCVTATCTMDISSSAGGIVAGAYNGTKSGMQFNINIYLTNTGRSGVPLDNNRLYVDMSSAPGAFAYTASTSIGLGGVLSPSFTGPNDRTPRGVGVNLYYSGSGGNNIGSCSTTINPYQDFSMTPTLKLEEDDPENPTQIRGNVVVQRTGGATDAPVSGTLSMSRIRGGLSLGSAAVSGRPGTLWVPGPSGGDFLTYNAPGGVRSQGWVAGDNYCVSLDYNYQSGWLGPGDDIKEQVKSNPGPVCHFVTNRPYVSVYGNDVSAGGGGLGSACGTGGTIRTYTKTGGAGSGTQLAAYAMDVIAQNSFKTVFQRTNPPLVAPTLPDGLTFGNKNGILGNYDVGCANDFYSDQYDDGDSRKGAQSTLASASLATDAIFANRAGGQSFVNPAGGTLTLGGQTGFTGQHTVFVDGDVFIDGDITYAGTGGWASVANIPYFTLIAKGNIYIKSTVTKLDGRYIAQPTGGTKGEIFTCADPSTKKEYSGLALWSQCGGSTIDKRLVVHGQFIAKMVHFLRTINTLSEGAAKESAANSKAAEVFEFSPEMYLARPAAPPTATWTSGEYEYISTLPPIL